MKTIKYIFKIKQRADKLDLKLKTTYNPVSQNIFGDTENPFLTTKPKTYVWIEEPGD